MLVENCCIVANLQPVPSVSKKALDDYWFGARIKASFFDKSLDHIVDMLGDRALLMLFSSLLH